METENSNLKQQCVSCTIHPDTVELIDMYAERRGLYRSNWLRDAISEKLRREIESETGITLPKRVEA